MWGRCAMPKVAISDRRSVRAGVQRRGAMPKVAIGDRRHATATVKSSGAAEMVESYGAIGGHDSSDCSGGIAGGILHT